jgi:hypothetical protein
MIWLQDLGHKTRLCPSLFLLCTPTMIVPNVETFGLSPHMSSTPYGNVSGSEFL